MREEWRALRMLLGTAWRTDPWRSAGLLLEPVSYLRFPLFAWFLKLLTDGVLGQDLRLLAVGAGGIAGTQALWFVGVSVGSWIRVRLSEQVGFVLDTEIAEHLAALPGLEHFERPDYQDRLELLRQGQSVLSGSLNALLNTANAVVGGIGTIAGLALVSPWLLLLVPFALPALPISAAQQRWRKEAEERSAEPGRRARHLQELTVDRAAGMELRVFGLQREVLARFRAASRESRGIMVAVERRCALLNSVGDLLFVAGFLGMVTLMLWRAASGQATLGEVVMAVYLGQQVRTGVIAPIRSVAALGEALRAAGRMLWLRDYARPAAGPRPEAAPVPDRLADGIVFERVSFRYPGTDRWVLRDVSFRIPAGAVVALVGENGAGKTTVVKLLARMYTPTEGRILVDGVDLATLDTAAWRTRLAAAFQDFARFEVPAQHTVAVGDLPRLEDRAAVRTALERAGGAGVLEALPAGAETQLGPRWEAGVDLSTGQWQKLALGRALMRPDPLMVFFDEPTASLDALAEHALFDRYARAARAHSARGTVTLLVSHRFSTVRSADLILVMEGGGIREMGDHDALVLRNGLYAELYSMQARAYR